MKLHYIEENILFIKLYCTIYILSAFFTPPLRWMGRAEVHSGDWVGGLLRKVRGGQPQLHLPTPRCCIDLDS